MARLDLQRDAAIVILSRRNLLALLHKLDWDGSARTIINNDCYRDGEPVDDLLLILRAEDDPEHYSRRADPAGLMHPATEDWIARQRRPDHES